MLFYTLDIIGTIAFAVSGALTAIEKRFDIFGIAIIAICTAMGGGTLRDVMIGNTPVFWMVDLQYFYIVLLSVFTTFLFHKHLNKSRKSLMLFDTIGLGIFTLIGIQKGLYIGLHPMVCILLGTITASFGGVIRDVLCGEAPIIFHKEIYATASIIGGGVFFLLRALELPMDIDYIITIATIISIRLLALKYHWELPQISN